MVYTDLTEASQLRFTLGYKFDSIDADNGDLHFTRIPVNLLVMTKTSDSWMLGAGVAYHLSPELDADASSIGLSGTAELDDALGFQLAFDYNTHGKFEGDWYLGGRITIIEYENQFGKLSGNSIGAVVGYLF